MAQVVAANCHLLLFNLSNRDNVFICMKLSLWFRRLLMLLLRRWISICSSRNNYLAWTDRFIAFAVWLQVKRLLRTQPQLPKYGKRSFNILPASSWVWEINSLLCALFLTLRNLYLGATISVTRLGDFLHFGQTFKAGGTNYFSQIAHIVSKFLLMCQNL